jgi:tetratricopeptide (TPR) repeat protein
MVARNNLAVTYTQVGEYDKAVKLFRGVIELEPNSPIAYNNLALCLARKKDLVESASILRQAARKFGAPFVATWVKAKDFDAVRDTAPFQNLLANLAAGSLDGPEGGSGVLLDDEGAKPETGPAPEAERNEPGPAGPGAS